MRLRDKAAQVSDYKLQNYPITKSTLCFLKLFLLDALADDYG
jgi:hypothetical protein